MFVHHPHDFRGVHRGTAAQRDDHVRFEGVCQLSALTHHGKGRVGFHFKEHFSFNAGRFQHGGDLVSVTVVEQETVGHNERTFVAVGNHFVQRDRQGAAAEVDGFRKFVPQHVFSSLSNGFLVDQVLRTDVFRDGVTAPGAATQRQGRGQLEVVEVTDTALGSRGVDQDTRGFHHLTEVSDALRLVVLVGVQAGGMADTAHRHQLLCFADRVLEIFRAVHRQRRGEFFVSKRLAVINNGDFANQDFGVFRHGEARQFSDFIRRLTHDSGVQRAIFQDNVLNGFQLAALQQVAAVAGETFANGVVYGIHYHNGLFRCADNAVIEGFGHQYGRDGTLDIGSFVDNHRGVACAHANRRFTGAVGCFHHARTACREDQVDIRVMHQGVGELNGRLIDPANQIFRRAGSDSRLQYDVSRFVGGVFSTWVRREDDGVTGLQADQRFEDSRGGRVSGRNDTADDTDRFSNSDGPEGVVLGQHAAGLFIFISVIDVFGSKVVFDHFIFNDTHAGFGNGHLSEGDAGICSGQSSGAEDFIDLFLSETGIFTLGFFYALDECVKFSDISNSHNALLIMLNFFSKSSARYVSIDRGRKFV